MVQPVVPAHDIGIAPDRNQCLLGKWQRRRHAKIGIAQTVADQPVAPGKRDIEKVVRKLLKSLETNAPPKDRAEEDEKRRERSKLRFARA